MRPSRITGRTSSCTRDYTREPHLPPRCRRGYRGSRDVSVTRRDESASISSQVARGLGHACVAIRRLRRGEVAHLDDEAAAEAEELTERPLTRRIEHWPHYDDVLALAQGVEPTRDADGEVALDACDHVVPVVARAVRVDVV